MAQSPVLLWSRAATRTMSLPTGCAWRAASASQVVGSRYRAPGLPAQAAVTSQGHPPFLPQTRQQAGCCFKASQSAPRVLAGSPDGTRPGAGTPHLCRSLCVEQGTGPDHAHLEGGARWGSKVTQPLRSSQALLSPVQVKRLTVGDLEMLTGEVSG